MEATLDPKEEWEAAKDLDPREVDPTPIPEGIIIHPQDHIKRLCWKLFFSSGGSVLNVKVQ